MECHSSNIAYVMCPNGRRRRDSGRCLLREINQGEMGGLCGVSTFSTCVFLIKDLFNLAQPSVYR